MARRRLTDEEIEAKIEALTQKIAKTKAEIVRIKQVRDVKVNSEGSSNG